MSRLCRIGSLLMLAASSSFSLCAPAPTVSQSDWPQFRGPKRDGLSADIQLLKEWPKDGPKLLWQSEPIGIGYSSVSLVGDRIFTMGDDKDSSYVYALDRNTGKKLWSTKVGKPGGNYSGTRCTPTVDEDLVYAIGQFGDLVCLKADSGEEVWRKDFKKDFKGSSGGWNYTESPLVDGDKLLCTPGGQKSAAIVALNKKTGELIWQADFGETAGYASMVTADVAGVRQYIQLLSQGIAGVSAKDGKLLWRYGKEKEHFAGNTANIPTPVVLGEYIYCAAGYGRGAALLKLSSEGGDIKAEEVYFKKELSNKHGGVIVIGDYAYCDREDGGGPECIEWKTGKVIWKKDKRISGSGSASLTYADGHLYIHFANGYVSLAEANPKLKSYEEKGTFKIPNSDKESWAHPVVAGGRLYLRDKDTLWCYDVSAK
jgi:outer membrane protein assembly factor BamB